MNKFYSTNIKNNNWTYVTDENIWFYPKRADKKYVISIEEIPYFFFWLSKSKNISPYFKNITFEFDITIKGIYFGYFKGNIDSKNYSKMMYDKYQRFNFHNMKVVIKYSDKYSQL